MGTDRFNFRLTRKRMELERSHKRGIHLCHLPVYQVTLVITQATDIDRGDLLAQCGRAPAGTIDPHMRRQGRLMLAGQVHDLNYGAMLVAQAIGHDDGGAAGSFFGTHRFAQIDIENIATIDIHNILLVVL